MKLVIAADHAGFPLKEEVRGYLERLGHEVVDLGAYNTEPSDYADFAEAVGKALAAGRAERGHPDLRQRSWRQRGSKQDAGHSRQHVS